MFAMTYALRWSWLLGIALFLPAALPAGGAFRSQVEICRLEDSTSFLAGDSCNLQVSPFAFSPSLRTVEFGTPLRVLRSWHAPNGKEWLQVQINTTSMIEVSSAVKRGWVNV